MSVAEPPFDDCVNERQPAETSPRLLLETDQVEARGKIPFKWAPGVDEYVDSIGVFCWTGEGWKPVWIVWDYARSGGRTRLVLTDEDGAVSDAPKPAVPGNLGVPAEAPPGWYRTGGGADFEVIASDAADG